MTNQFYKALIIVLAVLLPIGAMAAKKKQKQLTDREYWCQQAYKMAQPVLENMAKGRAAKEYATRGVAKLGRQKQEGCLHGMLRQIDGWYCALAIVAR